jgi:Xaa-Pro aminopeptidase
MHGESPIIVHGPDWTHFSMDGMIQAGMTLASRATSASAGGADGVKLEQEVVVTENGIELLSTYPFEDDLLVRHV